jgi:hypothetical protein
MFLAPAQVAGDKWQVAGGWLALWRAHGAGPVVWGDRWHGIPVSHWPQRQVPAAISGEWHATYAAHVACHRRRRTLLLLIRRGVGAALGHRVEPVLLDDVAHSARNGGCRRKRRQGQAGRRGTLGDALSWLAACILA